MRRTGKIGLIAAALLTAASSLPEPASSQVPDAFDVRNPGFAPASLPFDTKSMLMTASTGWVASQGMPGAFVGCPRPSPYMFGFNPGLFHYGWYMSPFDVRFSRSWFFPANRPGRVGSVARQQRHVRTWQHRKFVLLGCRRLRLRLWRLLGIWSLRQLSGLRWFW